MRYNLLLTPIAVAAFYNFGLARHEATKIIKTITKSGNYYCLKSPKN
jgi:hypothetical protein